MQTPAQTVEGAAQCIMFQLFSTYTESSPCLRIILYATLTGEPHSRCPLGPAHGRNSYTRLEGKELIGIYPKISLDVTPPTSLEEFFTQRFGRCTGRIFYTTVWKVKN